MELFFTSFLCCFFKFLFTYIYIYSGVYHGVFVLSMFKKSYADESIRKDRVSIEHQWEVGRAEMRSVKKGRWSRIFICDN
jgi:hypothetical protein